MQRRELRATWRFCQSRWKQEPILPTVLTASQQLPGPLALSLASFSFLFSLSGGEQWDAEEKKKPLTRRVADTGWYRIRVTLLLIAL